MISVIVPTYNRESCLYKMLQSLNEQESVSFEVLVIDQSESVAEEKLNRVLASCRNVQYFHINKAGRCLSKNFAIEKAEGDIILFCDDDIIINSNFLAEHLRVHNEYPEVGAVSCHLIEPHEEEIKCNMPLKITKYGRFINKPNAIFDGFVTSLNGGNMSFKRSVLKKVGFFDENLQGTSMLEEPDIAYRLLKNNYKLYFSSRSKVRHFPQHNGNVNIQKEKRYRWLSDYFFNQFYFVFRNKRVKYLPFVFTYLTYRTFVEAIKTKTSFIKFYLLPITSLYTAYQSWSDKRFSYTSEWYTPRNIDVKVLKHVSSKNEYIFK